MRYIVFWFVLVLVGCAGASSPPTSAPPDFPAAVDEPEGDIPDPVIGTRLTESETVAVRGQIEKCWNVPIGASTPAELVVDIRVQINRDRTVRSTVIVDSARMATDKYFRAMANSAVDALRNPRCNPLNLPPEKYEMWKEITLTFDASNLARR